MTLRAVDTSYDLLSDIEAQCLRDNEWPLVVQCLLALPRTGPEKPAYRLLNLQTALKARLLVAGYIVIGNAFPGTSYINQGREGIPDVIWDELKFIAVDVEVPGIHVDKIISAVRRVQELGKIPLIYTNANTWKNYIVPANDTWLAEHGVPLWNAFWDEHPDIDFSTFPFGGWLPEQVAIEQWSGGSFVCGQFVDRNTIEHPELINLEGGVDHMPTPEYEELSEKLHNLQTLVAAGLNSIAKGTAKTPIWPVGEVELTKVYHRGYHSQGRLDTLTQIVEAARKTLESHIGGHNVSGGPTDYSSARFLARMAELFDQIEREVRELAEATGGGQ